MRPDLLQRREVVHVHALLDHHLEAVLIGPGNLRHFLLRLRPAVREGPGKPLAEAGAAHAEVPALVAEVVHVVVIQAVLHHLVPPVLVGLEQPALPQLLIHPLGFRRHAHDLLVLQRTGLRDLSDLEGAQVIGKEEVEQVLKSSVVQIVLDALEIGVVLLVALAHLHDEEPAFIQPRRHHPIFVRGEDQVDIVRGRFRVHALALDHQVFFGHEGLEHAFVLLVPGEESLITEQQDGIAEVGVEGAHQVLRVADLEVVTPEHRAQDLGEEGLAGAAATAEDHGDFARAVRVLDHPRHPPDQVVVVLRVP